MFFKSFFSSIFFLLTISTTFACDINLFVKNTEEFNLNYNSILEAAETKLKQIGYSAVVAEAAKKVTIKLSKGLDLHQPDKYFAKTTLSFYAHDRLQHFTHGFSKHARTSKKGYDLENFVNSIHTAISHLPTCTNSY